MHSQPTEHICLVENVGKHITTLDLSNNYFSGTLHVFGQHQHNLRVASLNNNKFNGEIPSIIGQFIGLEELILSNNESTGSIPSQIGR